MFPGETFVRGSGRAYVTYILIVVNTIIYLLTSYSNFFLQISQKYLWEYSFVPVYLTDLNGWLRIFTSMFLHGYPLHIIFNMYFLYVFGKAVESYMGSVKYLILYLFSGFIASLTHSAMIFFMGLENLGIPALGASGAISGVVGSFLILFPGVRMSVCFFFFIIPLCGIISSTFFILSWFALQVIYGYLQLGGVAFFAHIGGFLAGILATVFLARRVREDIFPNVLYQSISFMYNHMPWFTYRRRTLGNITRFILITLTIVVAIGEMVSVYGAITSNYDAYYFTVKADLLKGSSTSRILTTTSSEAVAVVLRGQESSNYIIAPIVDETIRVLFNRLFYAGYIINYSLRNYEGSLTFSGLISIPGLKAPPVQLILLINTSYDNYGVLIKGEGSAVTDLLLCSGGVCEVGDKWFYNHFVIRGNGPVNILSILYIPSIVSVIVTFTVLIILIMKIDSRISAIYYNYDYLP